VIATRDVAVCGVVRCEVGRGVKSPKILERYQSFWNVMINVPTDHRIWEAVGKMLWRLDRQGTVLPLTDVVVACCALRIGAVVLTHDEHFQLIPGVRSCPQIL
jgi:predicted nucleic acid-binding protein